MENELKIAGSERGRPNFCSWEGAACALVWARFPGGLLRVTVFDETRFQRWGVFFGSGPSPESFRGGLV
ncbi:hypothetical protein SBV1_1060020 [Verrucomicrobia bacterium]|nr:hypothetical protein SBV1_1060020 [Verrucomicrobiota bacterium]